MGAFRSCDRHPHERQFYWRDETRAAERHQPRSLSVQILPLIFCESRVPHRTVPSFTVEIKRARKPSVHAVTGSVAAPDWDAHRRPKTPPFDDLFAATKPPSRPSLGNEAMDAGPQASVGRLLPSLALMNSLPIGEQKETREEPAQSRRARKVRGSVTTSDAPNRATASGEGIPSSSNTAEFVPPIPGKPEAHVTASSPPDMVSDHAGERRTRRGKVYGAAYRKAVRQGHSLPGLPAGERWKRRLPPACR